MIVAKCTDFSEIVVDLTEHVTDPNRHIRILVGITRALLNLIRYYEFIEINNCTLVLIPYPGVLFTPLEDFNRTRSMASD